MNDHLPVVLLVGAQFAGGYLSPDVTGFAHGRYTVHQWVPSGVDGLCIITSGYHPCYRWVQSFYVGTAFCIGQVQSSQVSTIQCQWLAKSSPVDTAQCHPVGTQFLSEYHFQSTAGTNWFNSEYHLVSTACT